MFVFETFDEDILPVRCLGFHYTFQTKDIQIGHIFMGQLFSELNVAKQLSTGQLQVLSTQLNAFPVVTEASTKRLLQR